MKIINLEQIEEKKRRIKDAAIDIIQEDGIDGLSIRKIAQQIEQTPGIIYHYYKDKDDILMAIVKEGYQEILYTLSQQDMHGSASDRLYQTLHAYIHLMLGKSDIFLILMQSKNPVISEQINLLSQDIRLSRKSIDSLCKGIEAGISEGIFHCEHVELRAQCIWCAIYGFLTRIINEKPEASLIEKLIDEELAFLLDSLIIRTQ